MKGLQKKTKKRENYFERDARPQGQNQSSRSRRGSGLPAGTERSDPASRRFGKNAPRHGRNAPRHGSAFSGFLRASANAAVRAPRPPPPPRPAALLAKPARARRRAQQEVTREQEVTKAARRCQDSAQERKKQYAPPPPPPPGLSLAQIALSSPLNNRKQDLALHGAERWQNERGERGCRGQGEGRPGIALGWRRTGSVVAGKNEPKQAGLLGHINLGQPYKPP